jgi:hypothetical protein
MEIRNLFGAADSSEVGSKHLENEGATEEPLIFLRIC